MEYSKIIAFIIFLCSFFSLRSIGQNKNAALDDFTFIEVLQDEKTHKILRHYQKKTINHSKPSDNLIVDEAGIIKNIGPLKNPLNYYDGYLLIFDALERKIIKYNSALEIINELPLKYPDGNVYTIKGTNNIILTDEFELSGTAIEFYSASFELVNSIKPHSNKEFFRVATFQANSDITSMILVFESRELCPQLIQLDSKTGEIKLETCLDLPKLKNNYFVYNVKITKDYLFVPTFKKFMVFDNKGNSLWEKPIYPAKYDYNEHIHIFDSKTQLLSSIHPASGEAIWKKEVNFYEDDSNLLLSDIISYNNKVNLLFGPRKGNKISNSIILDERGKFLKKMEFSNPSSKRFFLKDKKSGDILMIDDKKMIRYE